ncbi:hypothetical protein E2562_019964, partial [Oryza meyeriana var. granulata]
TEAASSREETGRARAPRCRDWLQQRCTARLDDARILCARGVREDARGQASDRYKLRGWSVRCARPASRLRPGRCEPRRWSASYGQGELRCELRAGQAERKLCLGELRRELLVDHLRRSRRELCRQVSP